MGGCHGRGSDHRRAHPAVESHRSRTRVLERPSIVSALGKGVEGMQLNASTEFQHGQTCTLAICLR